MDIYERQRTLKHQNALLIWLKTGMILTFLMVAIGGITRLTESGLSMVDWRPLMGAIPPLNQSDWAAKFELYKSSPQYLETNSHYNLADFKKIFLWEYVHRLLGRLLSIIFMVPLLFFVIKKAVSAALGWRLLIVLFLGGFQGVLGWYMVKSGLIDVPRVSHFRLAAHLVTAFITICYIYWLYLSIKRPRKKLESGNYSKLSYTYLGLLLLVSIQVIYGAFVAGKDAGWIHNTWPLMDGYVLHPAAINSSATLWDRLLYNSSMIQFVHRSTALLIAGIVFVFSVRFVPRNADNSPFLGVNKGLVIIVMSQVFLGISTLLWNVPITLAILHQLGALCLLLALVRALYIVRD